MKLKNNNRETWNEFIKIKSTDNFLKVDQPIAKRIRKKTSRTITLNLKENANFFIKNSVKQLNFVMEGCDVANNTKYFSDPFTIKVDIDSLREYSNDRC